MHRQAMRSVRWPLFLLLAVLIALPSIGLAAAGDRMAPSGSVGHTELGGSGGGGNGTSDPEDVGIYKNHLDPTSDLGRGASPSSQKAVPSQTDAWSLLWLRLLSAVRFVTH